jgi:phosphatidate cytidylyltransferase
MASRRRRGPGLRGRDRPPRAEAPPVSEPTSEFPFDQQEPLEAPTTVAAAERAEPTPRRRAPETLARIAWAIPWIAVAIVIIVIGELPFTLAMVAFAWIGLAEFFRMTARARPFVPVGFAAAAAIVIAAHYGSGRTMAIMFGASFPLMFLFAATRRSLQNITFSIAVTLLAIAWIGAPFAHAVLMRDLPLHGAALLVDVLVATFVGDTAAYAGGRLFGRHLLAPNLSPSKTWEGLAAGFVGGVAGFWFAGLYQDWLSGVDALILGAAVAALSPVGDLFESMIKRDLDFKDTGRAFGPHGGFLDRLDGVLFTVVAAYYLSIVLVY